MQPRRTRRMWLAATTAVAVIVVLTACTEPAPEPTPTPSETTTAASPSTPPPSPTETEDPAEAEARNAALAAYTAYWSAVVASFADPTQPADPALEANAGHTALADARAAIESFREDGIQMVGDPVFSPVATDVVLGESPVVSIADCLDVANWQPVFTASGESAAAPGQNTRVSYQTTVIGLAGTWLVWEVTVDREKSC